MPRQSKNGHKPSSAFVGSREPITVELTVKEFPFLERDEWVRIRNGVSTRMMFDASDSVPAFILRSIVDWSFDEEVSLENVEDLDADVASLLWQEVQKQYPLLRTAQPQTTPES